MIKSGVVTEAINTTSSDSLSDRLCMAMKYRKMSQSELARRINVKPQAIQYLCTSKAKFSSFTFLLAETLKINSRWLATGEGSMFACTPHGEEYNSKESNKKINVIQWDEIYDWLNGQIPDNCGYETLSANMDISPNSYGLRIRYRDAIPQLEVGTL